MNMYDTKYIIIFIFTCVMNILIHCAHIQIFTFLQRIFLYNNFSTEIVLPLKM